MSLSGQSGESDRAVTDTGRRVNAPPAQKETALRDDAENMPLTQTARGEVLAPGQVAQGWGNPRRKMHTSGHARAELARVYKKAAAGEITVEDLARITYSLERFSKIAELADAEERIEALERRVEELARNGR